MLLSTLQFIVYRLSVETRPLVENGGESDPEQGEVVIGDSLSDHPLFDTKTKFHFSELERSRDLTLQNLRSFHVTSFDPFRRWKHPLCKTSFNVDERRNRKEKHTHTHTYCQTDTNFWTGSRKDLKNRYLILTVNRRTTHWNPSSGAQRFGVEGLDTLSDYLVTLLRTLHEQWTMTEKNDRVVRPPNVVDLCLLVSLEPGYGVSALEIEGGLPWSLDIFRFPRPPGRTGIVATQTNSY